MTLREIYRFAVRKGMECDFRGPETLAQMLRERKEEFEALSESEKCTFDQERMVNPFGDTRLVCGDTERDITSVMVGIDIDGREILAWHTLNERGRRIDAIVAHHTSGLGSALASPYDTMCVQIDMMVEAGVPIHIAEKVICGDIAGRTRGEDYRNVMLADLFDVPILAIHTPADNYGFRYTVERMEEGNCTRVGECVEVLKEIPECQVLMKDLIFPRAIVGSPEDRLGKVYYCLAGGWNPTEEAFRKIAEAGVGTAVMVATSPALVEIARQHNMNLVLFPHYAFDSLGLNLLLDDLKQGTELEIVPCSNFVRVDREA